MRETTPMEQADDPRPDILKAAADWFALLACNEPDEATRRRWQCWFDADAAHRAAWARVEAISRRFELPPAARAALGKALDNSTWRLRRRRQFVKGLLGVGGVVALGASLGRTSIVRQSIGGMRADYSTTVGERREVTLADGSRVWMNTASAMDADYSAVVRTLQLRFGEILVDTAADTVNPVRPFVVETAAATLRALGTHFGVRQVDGNAQLAVFSGRVQVRLRDTLEASRIVEAGQQIDLTPSGIDRPQTASAAREAWTRGILLAEDVPLGDFLDELARYRRGLVLCDPAVAALRVVGGYPLADTDRVLSMLEAALPIRVTRRSNWWIDIGPR